MKCKWSAAPVAVKSLLVLLLSSASQLTLAQDMPRFDVEAHCEEVAAFSSGSYQILQSYMQIEEDAAGNRQSFSLAEKTIITKNARLV